MKCGSMAVAVPSSDPRARMTRENSAGRRKWKRYMTEDSCSTMPWKSKLARLPSSPNDSLSAPAMGAREVPGGKKPREAKSAANPSASRFT